MALTKKIEICVGTDRSRHVRARLSLLVMDGETIMSEHYHSINIHPGVDLQKLRAMNEAHLANPEGGIPGAPWPAIPDSEWQEVVEIVSVIQKPAVVERFRAKLAESPQTLKPRAGAGS